MSERLINILLYYFLKFNMAQMKKATSTTNVPHFFSPISVFSAESKTYIVTTRFRVRETFQINLTIFLIFRNTFVQGL